MEDALRPGVRVTLAMGESAEHGTVPTGPLAGQVVLKGRLAHPLDPKQQHGMYWGYQTRLASNLAAALSECPFQVTLPPVLYAFIRAEQMVALLGVAGTPSLCTCSCMQHIQGNAYEDVSAIEYRLMEQGAQWSLQLPRKALCSAYIACSTVSNPNACIFGIICITSCTGKPISLARRRHAENPTSLIVQQLEQLPCYPKASAAPSLLLGGS